MDFFFPPIKHLNLLPYKKVVSLFVSTLVLEIHNIIGTEIVKDALDNPCKLHSVFPS